MRHLQPDLKCVHIGQGTRIAPGVDGGELLRADVRNNFAVGEREIENGKIAMLMPHGRAQAELHVNQDRRDNRNSRRGCGRYPIARIQRESIPEVCESRAR